MRSIEVLFELQLRAIVSSLRRPVGWYIEHASEQERDALKELTSDSIKNVRIA